MKRVADLQPVGVRWRRWAARLVVAALAAGLALIGAGPDGLLPFRDAVAGAATAGEHTWAFVIDFGKTGEILHGCVKAPAGDNGYQALQLYVGHEPRFAPSGLLCAIDFYPASGCGVTSGGRYAYWSYWNGTSGTWRYATGGASNKWTSGDVQGWRFEDAGRGNASDPPPRFSANYDALCASPSKKTNVTPTPKTPAGSHKSGHGSGVTVAANSGTPTTSGSTGVSPVTSVPEPLPSITTTTLLPSGNIYGTSGASGASGSSGSGSATTEPTGNSGDNGGTGSTTPLIVIGGVLSALGLVALVVWWRRNGRS